MNILDEILRVLEESQEDILDTMGKYIHHFRKRYSDEEINDAIQMILFAMEILQKPIVQHIFEDYPRSKRVFVEDDITQKEIELFLNGEIDEFDIEKKNWV
ncbi:hypothetical protein [Thermotoga sp. KOL6]|uniref:hypothetical protein n=1 Tax=Thermotoga sp. KOL6 TaxID=126741 RepID=UPI000C78DF8C|nr:hypothetical protein [Thermotoga sp. KOL6]PLV60282.1 hypothetical protein AS005_03035 [Thermotoga sp. KOL6]